jgi:acetyltransferase
MSIIRYAQAGRFQPEHLFHPASVAVIGTGTAAAEVLANLRAGAGGIAYGGRIEAVADAGALSAAPDLAVLADEGDPAPMLAQLAARGGRAAVAVGMTPGLAAAAAASGVRVLGPGSFGIAVPGIGLNASRAHLAPAVGRLALVSQSAALCRTVLDWAGPNGVGFSHIIGLGGSADLGFAATLDWLSRDPHTGAILLDIRRIKNPRAFLSAARAASRLRPTVALRAGGRLLDPSGDADAAMEAALRRAGILSVANLENLLAAAETLTRARPARAETLAIVTNATGPGRLAADAAMRDGIPLAVLPEASAAALRASLAVGEGATAGLIHTGLDAPTRLAEVAAMVGATPGIGGILAVLAPSGAGDAAAVSALIASHASARAPLLVCAMGETTGAVHRARLAAAGIPTFATPEAAVRGFLHLVQDRRNRAAARELPPSRVLTVAPDRAEVRRIIARARAAGRATLGQDEALDVLSAYGVPTTPSRLSASAEDAADAAATLGFPVVAKLRRFVRPTAQRRGGLALDLHDRAEVAAAAATLLARAARADPETEATVLVQRQAARGREVMLRVADDPMFGTVLAFGQGGTVADAMHDVAFDLPPLNLTLADALIGRTRVAAALEELPDQDAADRAAVAGALVRVSQLVVDFPEIGELLVNPLIADRFGVVAVDAFVALRPAGDRASRLAIAPYPAELEATWTPRGGGAALTIRPIRPEDAQAHAAFFRRIPPEDIRFRFFSAMRELSAEQTARMTQVDYDREMAFIAVRRGEGGEEPQTVGVARLVCEADGAGGGARGEFAVLVQPDAKGTGLAGHLMRRLFDWARGQGVGEIVGQVLADNAPMLAFVRRLGFAVHRMPDEDGVMEARLRLDTAAAA